MRIIKKQNLIKLLILMAEKCEKLLNDRLPVQCNNVPCGSKKKETVQSKLDGISWQWKISGSVIKSGT